MAEDGKKISFGFSKLVKPKVAIISNQKPVKSVENIEFIECLEDKSIKVINEVPKKDEVLVIPLPKESVASGKRKELLQKILNSANNDNDINNIPENTASVNVSTNLDIIASKKPETLDEIAAREIIEDLKKVKDTENSTNNFTVPLIADETTGKESTADDYESIPVDKFGIAMLRGMGWAPGKGVGKTEQLITCQLPTLRPKGLGLGADKVIQQEKKSSTNEPLKLVKGSFVRIIAGVHKDMFGEIIAFDEESARLIVKMALGSNTLTFNEFMVELVSKEDFHNNSKVINVKKYQEYKNKEDSKGNLDNRHRNEEETIKKKYNSSDNASDLCEDSSRDIKYKSKQRSSNKNRSLTPEISTNKKRYHIKDKVNYESHKDSKRHRHSRSRESSLERDKSRRRKGYRSSSEDTSPPTKYKHDSLGDLKRRKSSSSESSLDSVCKKRSYPNEKRTQSKKCSSSSDYNSDYNRHKHSDSKKKKSKKHKDKKKSTRRSRSVSQDRKKSHKSHSKKHKKSKY